MTIQAEQAKAEADYERFLQDIEEDEELRAGLNLFKSSKPAPAETGTIMEESDVEGDDDDDFPEIKVDELLDEMSGLNLEDGGDEAGKDADGDEGMKE